jgi:hypothetical protein
MPTTIKSRQDFKQLLVDGNTFATTLLVIFVDIYGMEATSWSPHTIRMEIEDDLGVRMPQANFDRLMAAIFVLTTDQFFTNLPAFIQICNVLSGSPMTMEEFDPADSTECAWGLTEAMLISPPDEQNPNPFSDEITGYIGAVLDEEGILVPPDILGIAIRDDDAVHRVNHSYSDDPEMYSAIWGSEKQKTDDINDVVKERLHAMISQLQSIKLEHGNTDKMATMMLTKLEQKEISDSVLTGV